MGDGLFAHQLIVICSIPTNCSNLSVLFLFAFCVCVSTCAHVSVHMHTVSRWLCVRGQSRGTVPLHLRDSFNLLGPLTGNTTHKNALTITQRHTQTHACTHARASVFLCIQVHFLTWTYLLLLTLSNPYLRVSLLSPSFRVCVNIWLLSLRRSLECNSQGDNASLSALSPSSGAHLCWLPVASCTVNVKSCHFAQMHK